jgi:hypothetical protein
MQLQHVLASCAPHTLYELLCGRFVALVEVSGESRYGVVRLLLGGIDCYAHGLGLTLEGYRGTSTEEEGDRGRLGPAS